MNTDFECIECKHKFSADKNSFVKCPNCGSDNIKPASKNNMKYIIFAATFILAAVVGFFTFNKPEPKSDWIEDVDILYIEETSTPEQDFKIEEKLPEVEQKWEKPEEEIQEAEVVPEEAAPIEIVNVNLEIVVGELKYVEDSKTYSFNAKCNNVPEGIVLQWTLTTNDNKIVSQSENGEFKGIAPLENDGMYILTAEGKNEQYECKGSIYVEGCKVVKEKEQEQPQITKLTVDEVQASINDEKLYSKYIRNGQILNKLKIKVVDWGGYAEIEFKNLDDLIIASSMEGFTIKVVKVGYNTAGTVNYIEVTLE